MLYVEGLVANRSLLAVGRYCGWSKFPDGHAEQSMNRLQKFDLFPA
jgi:hypothetical protein